MTHLMPEVTMGGVQTMHTYKHTYPLFNKIIARPLFLAFHFMVSSLQQVVKVSDCFTWTLYNNYSCHNISCFMC